MTMRNAINYHGTWLMPGSLAHKLHEENKHQHLQAHMKRLSAEAHARGDVPYASGGVVKKPVAADSQG